MRKENKRLLTALIIAICCPIAGWVYVIWVLHKEKQEKYDIPEGAYDIQ